MVCCMEVIFFLWDSLENMHVLILSMSYSVYEQWRSTNNYYHQKARKKKCFKISITFGCSQTLRQTENWSPKGFILCCDAWIT